MGGRRYFGTDGIRGRVGQGAISADFVLRLGNALGRVLVAQRGQDGRRPIVVIGKDTRISGYMFEAALEAGLVAAGADVQLLGPMPTPAVAFLTRTLGVDAGIVISASHNPHYDNGIKFFSAQGEKLDDATELALEAALDVPFTTAESEKLGKAARAREAVGRYIEFCKASVPRTFDLRGMRLVLDCAHGATYQIAPLLFRELGAEVIGIGAEPNGVNINAGVGSTHIDNLAAKVRETRADLGIAFDGDAVIFSDEAERIYQSGGIEAFEQHERENAKKPLPEGPFARLLLAISYLQNNFKADDPNALPLRTALVTARSSPAHERVIRTLRAWDIRIDETFFMGGVSKAAVLAAFQPHMFFDDQHGHCVSAADVVPTGRVPYKQ
mgnify:CR=1 FL=1